MEKMDTSVETLSDAFEELFVGKPKPTPSKEAVPQSSKAVAGASSSAFLKNKRELGQVGVPKKVSFEIRERPPRPPMRRHQQFERNRFHTIYEEDEQESGTEASAAPPALLYGYKPVKYASRGRLMRNPTTTRESFCMAYHTRERAREPIIRILRNPREHGVFYHGPTQF